MRTATETPCFLDCGQSATTTASVVYYGETTWKTVAEPCCDECHEDLAANGELAS